MIVSPIDPWPGRINRTLHGRSVHRPHNCSGHNVYKGYNTPGTGDAIDLFCDPRTKVVAAHAGVVTRHRLDGTRKEVLYIESVDYTSVYAHVDATIRVGTTVVSGVPVAVVRHDLNDPHLHFELWVDGKAVHGRSPMDLLLALKALVTGEDAPDAWAVDAWEWAKEQKLLDGTRPREPLTRQEFAAVLQRIS